MLNEIEYGTANGRSPAPIAPRVLYVGGSGRSGSTMLGRMVGELPDAVFIGELRSIWKHGLSEDRLCGCGERFSACSFWTAVGDRAFGGWSRVDLDAALHADAHVLRHRFVPLMVTPGLKPSYRARLDTHGELLDRLYEAIAQVAGARTIVDTSKAPAHAYLLRRCTPDALRVVHLVRDARGVAYSWAKKVVEPAIAGTTGYMKEFHPRKSAVDWMTYNSMLHGLRALGAPSLLVRYEDLVAAPGEVLARVVSHAGMEIGPAGFTFLNGDEMHLGISHTIAGNPMRFNDGPIRLRLDEEWRERMDPGQRRVVSAITWPLRARYGYRGGR